VTSKRRFLIKGALKEKKEGFELSNGGTREKRKQQKKGEKKEISSSRGGGRKSSVAPVNLPLLMDKGIMQEGGGKNRRH